MLEFLFNPPALGVVLMLITVFGYISNWLNGRFLNFGLVRLLYYLGAFVHETSHAIIALFTGAKIIEYTVFARQPRVVYTKPKIPVVGDVIISFAPILGGLVFLFLLNKFLFASEFTFQELKTWKDIFFEAPALLYQIHVFTWQGLAVLLVSLNIGAMLGPSVQDLKNIWPALLLLLFIKTPILVSLALLALMLILVNIIIQLILILLIQPFKSS